MSLYSAPYINNMSHLWGRILYSWSHLFYVTTAKNKNLNQKLFPLCKKLTNKVQRVQKKQKHY